MDLFDFDIDPSAWIGLFFGVVLIGVICYFVYTNVLATTSNYQQIEADFLEKEVEPLAAMTIGKSADMTCQKSKVQYVAASDDKFVSPSETLALCYGIKVQYLYNNIEYKPYVIPRPGNTILLPRLHESDPISNKYFVEAAKTVLASTKPLLKDGNKIDVWIDKTSPEICYSYNPDIINIDTEKRKEYSPYKLLSDSRVIKRRPKIMFKDLSNITNRPSSYQQINMESPVAVGKYFPYVAVTTTIDGVTYTDVPLKPEQSKFISVDSVITATDAEVALINTVYTTYEEMLTAADAAAITPAVPGADVAYAASIVKYSNAVAAAKASTTPYTAFYKKLNDLRDEMGSEMRVYYNTMNPNIMYSYDPTTSNPQKR